ncbi:unnamed protein product [Clavelina lepadiformis]|uniref:Uncharacterized protein n=1 Tax=Clavelina lepadiformis TaxID=159417 RepID=A0ABP0EZV4_CLALP
MKLFAVLLTVVACNFMKSVSSQSCDQQIQVRRGVTGAINSPDYPNSYPANSRCTIRLIGASNADHITLTFETFRIEQHRSCQFDYLAIYDGPSTSSSPLGRFCGNNLPTPVISSGKYLTLYFHSDSSVSGDGFSIHYNVGCENEYTAVRGTILSPGSPSNYPSSSSCTYTLNLPRGSQVLLNFRQFDVEESSNCEFDFLHIETPLGSKTFCGLRNPFKRIVNTTRITLTFQSDRSVSRAGFQIDYSVIEGCSTDNGGCDQMCTDIQPGKVFCSCREGLQLDENGVQCIDINECQSSPCSEQCVNTIGSYHCRCDTPGYQLSPDNRTCTDMSCQKDNGGCEHICQPAGNAQYVCACHPGFQPSDDLHNCTDIDECTTTNPKYAHRCEHRCFNEPGSYYCDCHDGYKVSSNRRTCDDIDECPNQEYNCDQLCLNVPGGWECACYEGYRVDPDDPVACVDIDECDEGMYPDSCSVCLNEEGTYQCFCKSGFDSNDDNTDCIDQDECADDNGGCHQLCLNTPGSFRCGCLSGYSSPRNDSAQCFDINECAPNDGQGPCDHYCENMMGTFECSCIGGYRLLEDKKSCQDIDECSGDKNGGCPHDCVNTPGSFQCQCSAGFQDEPGATSAGQQCIDVNECEDSPCDVAIGANCSNSIGSFTCECPSGYRVEDVISCIDVNECTGDKHDCEQVCINEPGSFRCSCELGYTLVDGTDCVDINECSQGDICDQQCHNLLGSYRCDCNPGFFLLGDNRNCSDFDECAESAHNCDQICINEIGFHRCECRSGFLLNDDNDTCSDVNECASNTSGCSHHCVNIRGSFICHCDPGYKTGSDNKTCIDIDECANNNGGCHHICRNYNGTFECGCRDGFMFNGSTTCADIDECADMNGNCSQHCTNILGSYECSCDPNFKLGSDNLTCSHCPTCEQFEQVSSDVTMLMQLVTTVQQLTANNLRLGAQVSLLGNRVSQLEADLLKSRQRRREH